MMCEVFTGESSAFIFLFKFHNKNKLAQIQMFENSMVVTTLKPQYQESPPEFHAVVLGIPTVSNRCGLDHIGFTYTT